MTHSSQRTCRCYGSLITVPKKPPRSCLRHGWVLVRDGEQCHLCPPPSRTQDSRPNSSRRGYGSAHQRKRDALIKRKRYCEDPYRLHDGVKVIGTIRDHKLPLNQGGSDNQSNEQLLCVRCHNFKIYRDGSRQSGGG